MPRASTESRAARLRRDLESRVAFREFVASALYMALVLMAVLIALPEDRLPTGWALLSVLVGTAVGLTLAHWVAFRLAAQLAEETGVSPASAAREAGAQVAGGALAAVVASVPLLLLDGSAAVTGAFIVLAAMVALAGADVGRLRGWSWPHSILAGLAVLVVALAVVVVKSALGHH